MKSSKKILILFFLLILSISKAGAENFIPEQPVITLEEIRPGMTGYFLTVLKGTESQKIPVRIISVINQKPGTKIPAVILVKILNGVKLAEGMSGSPVFLKNKLAGAVRGGWENSDQTMALVTPIESMLKIFSEKFIALPSQEKNLLNKISVSGVSAEALEKSTGLKFSQAPSFSQGPLEIQDYQFKPGDAVAALLAWGDVEIASAGTITATDKNGKFLAFGHDFLKKGAVKFPAARVFVHDTVNSSSFPFKLASPIAINGMITHDTEAGIAGRVGVFPPSYSAELVFKNLDNGTQKKYSFRVFPDEFLTPKILEGVFTGLLNDAWSLNGQATMKVNLRIDGRNIKNGFALRDIFFADNKIVEAALKDSLEIIKAYLTQPFSSTMPAGFSLTVEATQNPDVLMIEDINTVSHANPGEEFSVKVKLRPWRGKPFTKNFKLKIPEDAEGVCELVVRGGSVEPLTQVAVNEGWKNIDSLERMLKELQAADSNNQLIIELNGDALGDALRKALSKKDNDYDENDDLLPEQKEFLSETKARRIKEQTLKIFSSEYFIDGMMKRIIHVEK